MLKHYYCILFLLLSVRLLSQEFIPGQVYSGTDNYTEYWAGNLPLIIAAPHGGDLRPDGIPNRSCAECVTINDAFTQELSIQLYQAIKELTGCYPHLIINRLHRSKLDANREIIEAAGGNDQAEAAWRDFHQFIDTAKFQVRQQFQKGLFVDMHGHAHELQRIEWGYLLSRSELQASDEQLDQDNFIDQSSIRNLARNNLQQLAFSDLIRGEQSLGTLVAEKGFRGVPSMGDPYPGDGEAYLSGGYNTRRHGSSELDIIDGIQVECNQNIRFNEGIRNTFANRFADALISYLQLHYFDGALNASCLFTTSGVEEKLTDLPIYPNPAKEFLVIDKKPLPDQARLFDLHGRLVQNWLRVQDSRLDLLPLQKGVYILMVYHDGQVVSRSRIIIGY